MTHSNLFQTSDAYYANTDARINTVLDQSVSETWRMIGAARKQYNDNATFRWWLESKWGIALDRNETGHIVPHVHIVDEKKYLAFILRFA